MTTVAVVCAVVAGVLAVVGAGRKTLEHPDKAYRRYRQLTGFSMLVGAALAAVTWVKFGELWFIVVMAAAQACSWAAITAYEKRVAADAAGKPGVDRGLTELLNGLARVLAFIALVLGLIDASPG